MPGVTTPTSRAEEGDRKAEREEREGKGKEEETDRGREEKGERGKGEWRSPTHYFWLKNCTAVHNVKADRAASLVYARNQNRRKFTKES